MTEEKKERKEERKGREEAGHPSSGGRLPPNATGDGRPCLYLYNRAILADRTQVAVELLVRVVTRLSVCLNGYIMAKL